MSELNFFYQALSSATADAAASIASLDLQVAPFRQEDMHKKMVQEVGRGMEMREREAFPTLSSIDPGVGLGKN